PPEGVRLPEGHTWCHPSPSAPRQRTTGRPPVRSRATRRLSVPLEVGLWRIDAGTPLRVEPTSVPLEAELERLIEADPTILGEPLLFIGRQVPTAHGKFIDLLAIDGEGTVHVLELKRDRTPRDVVA